MEARPLVFCADLLPVAMRDLVSGLKPQGFDLVFAEKGDEDERVAKIREADYLLVSWTPVPRRVIEAGEKLRLIQKYGIGVDKIDLVAASERGIPVCISAGGNSIAVAETAITLMLAVYKRLCVAHNSLREGKWLKWELRTGCYELWGKTVGIIGGGNIGRAVAKRLSHGFECHVLYFDQYRQSKETEDAMGMAYCPMEELLSQSDIVSVHVPLTPETRDLIGSEQLSRMKRSAVLINTSRGGVVDEKALIEALQAETIASAGLDVFAKEPPDADNPLFKMDNVVVTPHNGGGTVDTMKRVITHSYENMRRVQRGEPLPDADRVKA